MKTSRTQWHKRQSPPHQVQILALPLAHLVTLGSLSPSSKPQFTQLNNSTYLLEWFVRLL